MLNFLHFWDDRFLYITPAIQSGLTERSSTTLLASATGRPFLLEALDGTRMQCAAALVAPNVPRRLDADGCGLLSLNLDPTSGACRELAGVLSDHGIHVIDARCFGRLRERFEAALLGELDGSQLRELGIRMVDAVTGHPTPDVPLDPRIECVLHKVRNHVGRLPLRDLSAVACLSPDRLTHLFREQVGLSLKSYVLWAKILRSVQQFTSSRRLTDVALDGGFTDAAHMSRTFQRYFGLTPSFLADSSRVEISLAPSGLSDA
ncbi:AraC family transcriptional regulator [Cupriavidus basilensis]|uniref:AraC family transcriptional regulator n=1 Tax=Cupriavidus basilensis TaxID=68895 RepID=A0ABT6ASY2_9BURK|nr:AraC family transcriptional regulator [Cupriavidus basilensis]MDF3835705.1 AraC family transcriptional regulator [Cupriavidus basilensis]